MTARLAIVPTCEFLDIVDYSRESVLLRARNVGNCRERAARVLDALNARVDELDACEGIDDACAFARQVAVSVRDRSETPHSSSAPIWSK